MRNAKWQMTAITPPLWSLHRRRHHTGILVFPPPRTRFPEMMWHIALLHVHTVLWVRGVVISTRHGVVCLAGVVTGVVTEVWHCGSRMINGQSTRGHPASGRRSVRPTR